MLIHEAGSLSCAFMRVCLRVVHTHTHLLFIYVDLNDFNKNVCYCNFSANYVLICMKVCYSRKHIRIKKNWV